MSGLVLPGQREMQWSADGWTPGGFRLGIWCGLAVRLFTALFPCGYVANFIPLTSSAYGVFTMMYPDLILFDLLAAIYHPSLLLSICYAFRPQICLLWKQSKSNTSTSTTHYAMVRIDPFRCWNHVVGFQWPAYARPECTRCQGWGVFQEDIQTYSNTFKRQSEVARLLFWS